MKQISEKDFLNYIYKNAEMGMIGIDDVITKVKDEEFEKELKKERGEYNKITEEVENILNKYNEDNEEIGLMAKTSSKVMSEIKLLKDNSTETIAKMMIEGANKGIVALIEKINAYNKDNPEITNLANKFQKILENNIEELKKYL